MRSALSYLLFVGPSRERLHRFAEVYPTAINGGGGIRAVTRPTVSGWSASIGLNLGLDLRTPLAPFPPILRNEDGVFADVVGMCCPGALMGHLPAAVWHLPSPNRSDDGRDMLRRATEGLRSEHLLLYFVRTCGPAIPTADERRNFRILGEGLVGLGNLSPAVFATLVREAEWELVQTAAAQLLSRLEEYRGEPDYWAVDVRQVANHFRDLVTSDHFSAPIDLSWDGDPVRAIARFQRVVGGYGHLLVHWHDLVATAVDLRAHGVIPAPPVTS